jgi:hypothetical protein
MRAFFATNFLAFNNVERLEDFCEKAFRNSQHFRKQLDESTMGGIVYSRIGESTTIISM